MDDKIIFILKALLLAEALTHAVRSWGIFDRIRSLLTARSDFLHRLFSCFECTAVWTTGAVIFYLYFLDFWPLTLLIIISRLATIAHIAVDLVDTLRAWLIGKL